MNLKEDCCITMENEVIRIQTGNTDIWLLYSALTEVHRKEGLILFFGQKEFWAIPERVLGGEEEAQEWFRCLKTKCLENRDERIPMGMWRKPAAEEPSHSAVTPGAWTR